MAITGVLVPKREQDSFPHMDAAQKNWVVELPLSLPFRHLDYLVKREWFKAINAR